MANNPFKGLFTRTTNSKAVKVENSQVSSKSKMGGTEDQGIGYRTSVGSSHPLDSSVSNLKRAQEWVNLYYKEWTARKIVDIPVGDMLRGGWKYSGGGLTEEQVDELKLFEERLNFPRAMRQSLKMERLLGGSVCLMGIASENQREEASEPLNPRSIQKGDLCFINPIPRTRISKAEYDVDPFSPTFNRAKEYLIYGSPVHRSRLLVFDGDPLTENQGIDFGARFISRDGMGESILAPIWDDIIRAAGTRQAAYHLVNRASILLLMLENKAALLENKQGSQKIKQLSEIADQLSMFQAAVVDDKNAKIDQLQTSFGSVPELFMNFLQVISAASDIPATRFLGQAPGGLNATGESDLENYYNSIEEQRGTHVKPRLLKFLHIAAPSLWGQDHGINLEEVEIEFESLWQLNDVEASTVRLNDTQSITAFQASGIISDEEAIAEARERGVLVTDATDPEKNADIGGFPNDDTDDGSAGSLDELRGLLDAGDNLGGTENPEIG